MACEATYEAQRPVVILYKHALLGEGIARYLRMQSGVEAMLASAHDPEEARSALALNPSVVIFESNDPFQHVDVSSLAPNAVLIDVSTVVTRGSAEPGTAGLEQILQAVRDSTIDSSVIAGPLEACAAPEEMYLKSTVRRMGSTG